MKRLFGLLTLITLAASGKTFAQTIPAGLETQNLPTVFLTERTGAKIEGKLLRLDGDGVLMVIDGAQKHYAFTDVRKVEKRGDSLKNGAIAGLVVGGIVGVLSGALSENAADTFGIAMISTMVYGAIGTCMDAMVVGRTTLYQQSVAHQMAPSAGPRAAVKFSMTW